MRQRRAAAPVYFDPRAGAAVVLDRKHSTIGIQGMTPGVMTCKCEHGIVQGFWFMPSSEGPLMLHEIIWNRFPGGHPSRIVYDYACKYRAVGVAREPSYCSKGRAFIDRLHWNNHATCSSDAHNMTLYDHVPAVRAINSQGVEQYHAEVARRAPPLRTSSVLNAVYHRAEWVREYNLRRMIDMARDGVAGVEALPAWWPYLSDVRRDMRRK